MTNAEAEWKAKNTMWVSIRIQNSSGIPEALSKALEASGKTKNSYIIGALREKLICDGYMSESEKTK